MTNGKRTDEVMLQELSEFPGGLLDAEARQLQEHLGGPTLIHLPGEREPALFVSVLLHGNEHVGWDSVRRLLAGYHGNSGFELPRALTLFIGNVKAAAAGVRRLEGQPDYNRVWPGSDLPETPEHHLMRRVMEIMERRGVFASVDVHNNSGTNPHYAAVNVLESRSLQLATLFGRIVVYFRQPKGVQSMAMARLCPAVILECGKVGQQYGKAHALDYLDACLHLAEVPGHRVAGHDIDLFHTVATVRIPEELGFSVTGGAADLEFRPQLDHLNFRELHAGTVIGWSRRDCDLCLEVRDGAGRDVGERYFERRHNELRLRVPVMPSMLTLDERVIRQDCFCYLMERYNDHIP